MVWFAALLKNQEMVIVCGKNGMKGSKYMLARFCVSTLLIVMGSSFLCIAGEQRSCDLLSNVWQKNISSGQIELDNKNGRMVVNIKADGEHESFPYISLPVNMEDWREYTHIKASIRITAKSGDFERKKVSFICYSDDCRIPGLKGNPSTQQFVDAIWLKKNEWTDMVVDLSDVIRANVTCFQVYFYENPPLLPHEFEVEIKQLRLEGPSGQIFFDGVGYERKDLPMARSANVAKSSVLKSGLEGLMKFSDLKQKASGLDAGFLVRDVQTDRIYHLKGKFDKTSSGVKQIALLPEIGLDLRAYIEKRDNYFDVNAKISSTDGKDKMLTVYFLLPVGKSDWRWGQSLSKEIDLRGVAGCNEYIQNRYPMSALSSESIGLSFGVPIDKPVVNRIVYNSTLGLYYIAFDVSLIAGEDSAKRKLSQAEMNFALYSYDPKWGLRAAVERYYEIFPKLFTRRADYGGWGLHRTASEPPATTVADGYKFSWQPYTGYYAWNAKHDVYNLFYIEPEFQQISMGDYDYATSEQVRERLEKLSNADADEIEKCKKLKYFSKHYTYHMTAGGLKLWGKTLDDFMVWLGKIAKNSTVESKYGYPEFTVSRRDWIGDSCIGAMFLCNLDPDIPYGKGWFNTHIALKYQIEDVEKQTNTKVDGLALDCLLWEDVPDCSREHLLYSDFPLSHCAVYGGHKMMVPASFSTIEWLKDLKQQKEYRNKIIMANLGSAKLSYLAFAANELDVFGIENTYVPDPDLVRTVAYNKPVTDLHYSEVPEWRFKFNLLHAVFPGQGHNKKLLLKYAPLFKKLTKAGWQPVTALRSDNEKIRIERYGAGDKVYFAIHNSAIESKCKVRFTIDKNVLPDYVSAKFKVFGDEVVSVADGGFELEISALDTVVLESILKKN